MTDSLHRGSTNRNSLSANTDMTGRWRPPSHDGIPTKMYRLPCGLSFCFYCNRPLELDRRYDTSARAPLARWSIFGCATPNRGDHHRGATTFYTCHRTTGATILRACPSSDPTTATQGPSGPSTCNGPHHICPTCKLMSCGHCGPSRRYVGRDTTLVRV